MTTVYLAFGTSGVHTLDAHADQAVDLLVAYPYRAAFLRGRKRWNVRRWALDSGAFTAHHSGRPVDLEEFTAFARDSDAAEVFALDVIGDHAASLRNHAFMVEHGVPGAIPTFHYGGTREQLLEVAAAAEKIALGGMARAHERHRLRFARESFAVVWPKRVHGFACASQRLLDAVPFHSVDATSWTYAPSKLGQWAGFSGRQQPLPGVRHAQTRDYWLEVELHQRRARRAAGLWQRELARLGPA